MNALIGNAKPKLTHLNNKGPLPIGASPHFGIGNVSIAVF
jgi:hypothetical protein